MWAGCVFVANRPLVGFALFVLTVPAVVFALSATRELTSGTYCGTAFYLAPEMISSRRSSPGTDHWALGVCLFQVCFILCVWLLSAWVRMHVM